MLVKPAHAKTKPLQAFPQVQILSHFQCPNPCSLAASPVIHACKARTCGICKPCRPPFMYKPYNRPSIQTLAAGPSPKGKIAPASRTQLQQGIKLSTSAASSRTNRSTVQLTKAFMACSVPNAAFYHRTSCAMLSPKPRPSKHTPHLLKDRVPCHTSHPRPIPILAYCTFPHGLP